MKKVRIMLAAVIVMGSVGGALAFKAKTFGSQSYCTTTIDGGNTCPVSLTSKSFTPGQGVKYVVTNVPTFCERGPACTSVGVPIN